MREISRRRFIAAAAGIASASMLPLGSNPLAEEQDSTVDLVRVENGEPEALVETALKSLGGMERFVNPGDTVVVKPNIGWDRNPQQGADTHPEIVAAVVKACLEAKAREVQVFDHTCNSASRCYDNSGIGEAAKKAGAKVSFVLKSFFRNVKIKDGAALKKWKFYQPALEADKYINLPILKQHSLCSLTIGLKNIMGVIGGNRGSIHNDFDRKIVDLNTVIRPALTIVDATRVLRRNGPVGGNLADVDNMRQLIAGIDPVAVDAAAAELFGIPPERLGFIMEARNRGLGSLKGLKRMTVIKLES